MNFKDIITGLVIGAGFAIVLAIWLIDWDNVGDIIKLVASVVVFMVSVGFATDLRKE